MLISPRKFPQNTKMGTPKWISWNSPDQGFSAENLNFPESLWNYSGTCSGLPPTAAKPILHGTAVRGSRNEQIVAQGPCNYNDYNDDSQSEKKETTGGQGDYHLRLVVMCVCDKEIWLVKGKGKLRIRWRGRLSWLRSCRIDYRKGADDKHKSTTSFDGIIRLPTDFRRFFSHGSRAERNSNNGGNYSRGNSTTAENSTILAAAIKSTTTVTTISSELYKHYEHTTPLFTTDTTASDTVDLINPLPGVCAHYLCMLHHPQARLPQPTVFDGATPLFHESMQETRNSSASTTTSTTTRLCTIVWPRDHPRRGDYYWGWSFENYWHRRQYWGPSSTTERENREREERREERDRERDI